MSSKIDVMVDLETLGTRPGDVILQIGAVVFDRETGDLSGDQFCENIDMEDSARHGFRIEPRTIQWWMGQDKDAIYEVFNGGSPVRVVLDMFSSWILQQTDKPLKDICLWGNGPTFDNAMLRAHYQILEKHVPWNFRNDRCFRTYCDLNGIDHKRLPFDGVRHTALQDAIHQAKAFGVSK